VLSRVVVVDDPAAKQQAEEETGDPVLAIFRDREAEIKTRMEVD